MKNFKQRSKILFPSIYLTLISIIQSFVLEQLFSTIKENTYFWNFSSEALILWLQGIAVFIIIILVWQEYVSGIIAFSWTIGVSDAFIPFCFGLFEFAIIALIQPQKINFWFYSLAGFAIIALWAYQNMYIKSEREDNKDAFEKLGNLRNLTIRYIYLFIGLFLFLGILINISYNKYPIIKIIAIIITIVSLILFMIHTVRCLTRLYLKKDIKTRK